MNGYIKNYPRPQFVREQWQNLNGAWDFAFDDEKKGEKEKWYQEFPKKTIIQVPFTYETKLSGIQEETFHDTIWYHRSLLFDKKSAENKRIILHFEGSDFYTKVWLNGIYVGSHKGGYSRFSFDVTEAFVNGENHLTVEVQDSMNMQQPRGKQRWMKDNFGCWYVQTTGIWKTVWMETVSEVHLNSVKMTPDLENYSIHLEFDTQITEEDKKDKYFIETVVSFDGQQIGRTLLEATSEREVCTMSVFSKEYPEFEWGVRLWTPETPNLYDIEFRIIKEGVTIDQVKSYFAMREIRIEGANILLNGKPLYQRLILDQGYWKDSHLTPPDEEALIQDIEKIHFLGYNGLRKHQKVEDERFLYWCDKKGMLVWCESPSAYEYSDWAVEEFTKEWLEIVRQNYNHPCIITWTPFNESWGISQIKTKKAEQQFTEAIYHLTKSIDFMRPVIVNDGWEHTVSDILTLHDYEQQGEILKKHYMECGEKILQGKEFHNQEKTAFACGYTYKGQPVIISEYGGIAFDNEVEGWGYGDKVKDEEAFLKRFDELTTGIKEIPYVCGFCYTQVTDVQQEINGLMDIDRNYKVNPEVIREINKRQFGFRRKY